MKQFHPLKVVAMHPETRDSVRIALEVPTQQRQAFEFQPGQHLPLQVERAGSHLRRTYSICSEKGLWPLEIGVRIQPGGQFSEFVSRQLKVGDELEAMPPTGRFHAELDTRHNKFYLGFAAGSGITPILSIAKSVLKHEPNSRFALFYGNRKQSTSMFIEDLFALKNRYPERLQLHFVFSREEQEFEIASGRIDAEKVAELYARFCGGDSPDEAFVCGPDSMTGSVTEALAGLGMRPESIHSERFGAARGRTAASPPVAGEARGLVTVTVIMDGHKKSFRMRRAEASIVDAAAENGLELPYSCKGGVCATCRTHLRAGQVQMQSNYGLEPWEVEAGFVLACQSRPLSDTVLLDYDKS